VTSEDPSRGSSLWPTLNVVRIETLVVSTDFAVEGTIRAAVNRGAMTSDDPGKMRRDAWIESESGRFPEVAEYSIAIPSLL